MKYDIAALKRKMLVKYPFFGSVVASVDYKENKGIPTAGTDGKTIYYNPDFLESLSVEQQTFVFAHESLCWLFAGGMFFGSQWGSVLCLWSAEGHLDGFYWRLPDYWLMPLGSFHVISQPPED